MLSPFSDSLSQAHHQLASAAIAGGVNSNVRLAGPGSPLCFASARGAHLTDINGNDYVDYALGMGPAILGHAPKAITDAVSSTLVNGQLFGGQSRLELDLANRLRQHLPFVELVRIGMTGSEMVQAALRVARAATERNKIVKFSGHYHGWFDNVLTNAPTFARGDHEASGAEPLTRGQTPNSLADTVILPWNDVETMKAYLQRHGRDTAAIIMELVMCNTGVIPPNQDYLEEVRHLCDEHGVVLIADEVVTGFRLGLGGAQGLFKVSADLSVFAKALGAGVPIAALTGRRSLMSLIGSGAVNHSGTYNSNAISLAAAIATLDVLSANEGAVYSRIERAGTALMDGLRAISKQLNAGMLVQGYPSVFNTSFVNSGHIASADEYKRCDQPKQERFLRALIERGIRPTSRGTWFVSTEHATAEVERTLSVVHDVLNSCM